MPAADPDETAAPALRSYDGVAAVYDALALAWTGGAIGAAGAAASVLVRPGDRVLVAGVGGGRDAAALGRAGARLTLVDLSPAMLGRAVARVRRAGGVVEDAICGDALTQAPGGFDLVCAHYFLNVFAPHEVGRAFAALGSQVRVGGRLSVADFAPGQGLLRRAHHAVPMEFFSRLGLCARHPIYDYAALCPEGLTLLGTRLARIYRLGPAWHQTWFFAAESDDLTAGG